MAAPVTCTFHLPYLGPGACRCQLVASATSSTCALDQSSPAEAGPTGCVRAPHGRVAAWPHGMVRLITKAPGLFQRIHFHRSKLKTFWQVGSRRGRPRDTCPRVIDSESSLLSPRRGPRGTAGLAEAAAEAASAVRAQEAPGVSMAQAAAQRMRTSSCSQSSSGQLAPMRVCLQRCQCK